MTVRPLRCDTVVERAGCKDVGEGGPDVSEPIGSNDGAPARLDVGEKGGGDLGLARALSEDQAVWP